MSNHLMYRMEQIVYTEQEKERIWAIILKIINLIKTVRKEGLLCLEEIANQEHDVFLRSCLRYILETDPSTDELSEYVSIWIAASNVSAVHKLEMAIIGDGLEQLLLQRTPSAALLRLGAWLGTEFTDRIEKMRMSMNQVQRKARTESLKPEFDQLLTLSDKQLCKVFEQLQDDHLLSLALMGAAEETIDRVRTVVSVERWEQVENKMNVLVYPRACDVQFAQEKLINVSRSTFC